MQFSMILEKEFIMNYELNFDFTKRFSAEENQVKIYNHERTILSRFICLLMHELDNKFSSEGQYKELLSKINRVCKCANEIEWLNKELTPLAWTVVLRMRREDLAEDFQREGILSEKKYNKFLEDNDLD